LTRGGRFDRDAYSFKVLFEGWAVIRPEFEDRDAAALQVLLMLEVLVGNDEDLKSFGLGAIEQIAVADPLPAISTAVDT
jgi:hypothetical protein